MNMMQDDDYAYECSYVFAPKIKNMIAKHFLTMYLAILHKQECCFSLNIYKCDIYFV